MGNCAEISSSVYPSGAALASMLAAMVPDAPGRFSITTGWPHISLSLTPTVRARMSLGLPNAPPSMRTGLTGYFTAGCDNAGPVAKAPRVTTTEIVIFKREHMGNSPLD